MGNDIQLKTCTICKRRLPLNHFWKDRRASDDLDHACKKCQKARRQEESVKEHSKIYFKEYRNRPGARQRIAEKEKIRRKKPDIKKKISAYHKAYREKPENKVLIKAKKKLYQQRPYVKEKRNLQFKARRNKWYTFIESTGYTFKCHICGYDKCKPAIDFHHQNGDKDFALSKFISNNSFNSERQNILLNELRKGVFLCANCHRESHTNL